MDDNSLSIDLRKVRKNLPPPPIPVAPLNTAGRELRPTPMSTPAPMVAPPSPSSSPARFAPTLPPKPKWKLMGKWPMPSLSYVVFAILILAVLGGGYYIYERFWSQSPFGPTQAPTSAEPAAAIAATSTGDLSEGAIIAQVAKLMLLPADETPTLAKVSDAAALQGQVFFKNAVVGDVVLMYAKSLRAILYDPAQNKIIEVGPITAATSTATTK